MITLTNEELDVFNKWKDLFLANATPEEEAAYSALEDHSKEKKYLSRWFVGDFSGFEHIIARILKYLSPNDIQSMRTLNSIFKNTISEIDQRVQKVYVYGWSRYGAHGVGNYNGNIRHPLRVKSFGGISVTQVSCGTNHTGFITDGGIIFTCGRGAFGQLGNGKPDNVSYPSPVIGLDHISIRQISCGYDTTGVVSTLGDIFMCGNSEFGKLGNGIAHSDIQPIFKKVIGFPNTNIKQISCGKYCTGIVSYSGHAFMCGSTKYGRFGNGIVEDRGVSTFTHLFHLNDYTIKEISCADYHTGVVTTDGKVLMCGNGRYGKLGNGNNENVNVARFIKVRGLDDIPIEHISCSKYTSGVLSRDGNVYLCGRGKDGRLGDGNLNSHIINTFTHVPNLSAVVDLECGLYSTNVVVSNGDVLTSGFKLAHDQDFEILATFTKVDHLENALHISSGGDRDGVITMIITRGARYKVGSCIVCSKPSQYRCVSCNMASYCSKECQRNDWDHIHYIECNISKEKTI